MTNFRYLLILRRVHFSMRSIQKKMQFPFGNSHKQMELWRMSDRKLKVNALLFYAHFSERNQNGLFLSLKRFRLTTTRWWSIRSGRFNWECGQTAALFDRRLVHLICCDHSVRIFEQGTTKTVRTFFCPGRKVFNARQSDCVLCAIFILHVSGKNIWK